MDEPTIDEQVVIGGCETDDGLNGGGGGGGDGTANKEVKTENIAFDENISENAPPRPVRANRASRNSGGGGLSMATKSNLTPAKKSNKRPVVHIDTHWSSDEEEFAGFDVSSGMCFLFCIIRNIGIYIFITNRQINTNGKRSKKNHCRIWNRRTVVIRSKPKLT